MAKKKQGGENLRYAVNKKFAKQAKEQAAREQAALERRMENRQKSRGLGNAFLFAVLALVGVFCLYTLFRTLFSRASSVSELRDNLLFLSLVSIPYLLGMGAVLVRFLTKKRRENWSERSKRLGSGVFFAVLLGACLLFGWQFLKGKTDASAQPAYTQTVEALRQSGLPLTEPAERYGVNTLLEYSLQTDLLCGKTLVRLNYHSDGSGRIAQRFLDQAARDYAACPLTERDGKLLWGPAETGETARAAVALPSGTGVRVIELSGPGEELALLLPLLAELPAQP